MSKRTSIVLSIVTTVLVASGIVVNEAATATRTIEVPIEGMHCESCANSLTKALGQSAGVHDAKVSFDDKRAYLVVSRWNGPAASQLRVVVEEAGYSVPNRADGTSAASNP